MFHKGDCRCFRISKRGDRRIPSFKWGPMGATRLDAPDLTLPHSGLCHPRGFPCTSSRGDAVLGKGYFRLVGPFETPTFGNTNRRLCSLDFKRLSTSATKYDRQTHTFQISSRNNDGIRYSSENIHRSVAQPFYLPLFRRDTTGALPHRNI